MSKQRDVSTTLKGAVKSGLMKIQRRSTRAVNTTGSSTRAGTIQKTLGIVLVLNLLACVPKEAGTHTQVPAPPKAAVPASADALFAQHGDVTITTDAGPITFAVELALTDAERQHGLMYRDTMADDAGMLFVFEHERIQTFWMKNTHLPLDMIFIANDGTIAGIVQNAEPLTLTSRFVKAPSRYVLELNAGTCAKRGLRAGQQVRFAGVPPHLVDPRVLP